MARIRTIKPEITSDEKLARVSRESRLTFILSITQADDDGLILASPRQLLAALYPVDEGVTDKMLTLWTTELMHIGLWTQRYTQQGHSVIQITNWEKHQRIVHPGKSIILPTLAPLSRDPREDVARPSRSDPHTYDPHTPVPTTPISGAEEASSLDEQFAVVWTKYPRRAGSNPRQTAQKAFLARLADGVALGVLEDATARYAAFCADAGKVGTEFVMQGQRFFGPNGGWREVWDIPTPRVTNSPATGRQALAAWLTGQGVTDGF